MSKHLVLIDFENVQPDSVAALAQEPYRVLVFVGSKQGALKFEIVESLHRLGPAGAEYIKISRNGSNALDFHIAYYIGKLAAENPAACFHIVSKDGGFDALIEHLQGQKISVRRVESIRELALPKPAEKKVPERKPLARKPADRGSGAERLEVVLAKFRDPKFTKPGTIFKLPRTINALFQNNLTDAEVTELIEKLRALNVMQISGAKVLYNG
jgi:hypothetical protein